jgi:hypothetical protein
LYVKKARGSNNYNYSDVKSFYLTTDRGLNRILSIVDGVMVPETILPSQLFIIHNPASSSSSKEPDYKTFFRFLKRRTSEFKLRGKDVINYITQARIFTTDNNVIASLIEAYSDQRYKHSLRESVDEGTLITFRDFSATYFDKRNAELNVVESSYNCIKERSELDLFQALQSSNNWARALDVLLTLVVIPAIALLLKIYTHTDYLIIGLILLCAELIKFFVSTRTMFLKNVWLGILKAKVNRSAYYKLTNDSHYLQKAIDQLHAKPDNIWKR